MGLCLYNTDDKPIGLNDIVYLEENLTSVQQ